MSDQTIDPTPDETWIDNEPLESKFGGDTIDIPTVEVVDIPRPKKSRQSSSQKRRAAQSERDKKRAAEERSARTAAGVDRVSHASTMDYASQLRIGGHYGGGVITELNELCPEYPGPHVHVRLSAIPGRPSPRPSSHCVRFGFAAAADTRSIAATYEPSDYVGPKYRPPVEPEVKKKKRKKDEEGAELPASWRKKVL